MDRAKLFAKFDPNTKTRDEIQGLVTRSESGDEEATKTIAKLFGTELRFGTSGLRGPMGPGSSRMNQLVVIQTTQGLCAHLESEFGLEKLKEQGVVIGFDHRALAEYDISSKEMAEYAAAVFLQKGVKTYLFSDLVHTPMIPFTIVHQKCVAGIMVTASHNPRQDDGYKVYWENGASILSPHDVGIQTQRTKNAEPWTDYTPLVQSGVYTHARRVDPSGIIDDYISAASRKFCHNRELNQTSDLKIVYTAMHGVGTHFVERIFESFGHSPAILVKSQCTPDPTFPTVAFPNPEEAGALKIGTEVGEAVGANIVIATDPDADRFSFAERSADGNWKQFNGNEIATILAAWTYQFANKSEKLAVVISAVSSKFLHSMGKIENFECHETHTGFKWISNKVIELEKEGRTVFLSYEQAIGFSLYDLIRDKDGVSVAAVFAEIAKSLYQKGSTFLSYLNEQYEKYGWFVSSDGYVFVADPQIMNKYFENLRAHKDLKVAIAELLNLKISSGGVRRVIDYTVGYDSEAAGNKSPLPVVPDSQHLCIILENETCIQIRGSGTEPKLKFYVEAKSTNFKNAQEIANEVSAAVIFNLLNPGLNGFDVPDATQTLRQYLK